MLHAIQRRLRASGSQLQRVVAFASRHRKHFEKVGLIAALLLFTGGLILTAEAVPGVFQQLEVRPFILLVTLAVPVTIALNTVEFRLIARYAGVSVSWPSALQVSVYTSAANMLPIPGGVLTRLAAMRVHGTTLKVGSLLILLFAGVWGGLAFVYSGLWIAAFGHYDIGAGFTATGAGMLVPSIVGLRGVMPNWTLLFATVGLRLAALVVEAIRFMLAIHALGVTADFAQASIFGASGFVATVALIAPGGLGLHEFLSALLAPLSGLGGPIGFLSATVNRIAVILGLLAITALLISVGRRPREADVRVRGGTDKDLSE